MNVLRRGAQHQVMYGTDDHEASHVKRFIGQLNYFKVIFKKFIMLRLLKTRYNLEIFHGF